MNLFRKVHKLRYVDFLNAEKSILFLLKYATIRIKPKVEDSKFRFVKAMHKLYKACLSFTTPEKFAYTNIFWLGSIVRVFSIILRVS